MNTIAKTLLIALLPFLCLASAKATVYCDTNHSGRTDYQTVSIPVLSDNVMISALRDLPVGSVLFRQYVHYADPLDIGWLGCQTNSSKTPEKVTTYFHAEAESSMPSLSGITYNGHSVYNSSVAGVGIVFFVVKNSVTSNKDLPYSESSVISVDYKVNSGSTTGHGSNFSDYGLELLLVKTGDIPSGTWTIPINLPPIIVYRTSDEIVGPERDYGLRMNITGNVNILSGTCQTPDVDVDLGTHRIDSFTNNTEWINFSITLLNCPPMFGRYNRSSSDTPDTAVIRWNSDTDTTISLPDQMNQITYILNPISGYQILSSGGYCAAISGSEESAEGVCIEIVNKDGVNVISDSKSGVFNDSQLSLLQTGAGYTIPFKARYSLISGETLKPGTANSSVEFTLNYQ